MVLQMAKKKTVEKSPDEVAALLDAPTPRQAGEERLIQMKEKVLGANQRGMSTRQIAAAMSDSVVKVTTKMVVDFVKKSS